MYIRWIAVCFMMFFRYHVYICIYVVLQRASRKIGSPIESPSSNKVFTYLLTYYPPKGYQPSNVTRLEIYFILTSK